jgi:nucleotide-binding universal stress UspA family protein
VPLSLPLDARLHEEEDQAEALLDDAQALVESYGVRAVTRLLRARRAGPAIVEEARRRHAELVVLGAPRRAISGRRRLFGKTVDYVLREAPCRVLIATGRQRDVA